MAKKILPYLFCFVAFVIVFFIFQGRYTAKIDQISNELSTYRTANQQLRTNNTLLTDTNKELTERVGILEKQIDADNRANQERLEVIGSTLETIAIGLANARGNLHAIIEGIEQIKRLIESL